MLKTLNAMNTFMGLFLVLVVLAGLSYGAWVLLRDRYADQFALGEAQKELQAKLAEIDDLNGQIAVKDRKIGVLETEVERQKVEIERLDLAVRLLTTNRRLARIKDVRQTGSEANNDLVTEFSFVEIDDDGREREAPRRFKIEGDVVYIDSWVIKFKDEYVQVGDPLRSASICMFRRLFGENQPPAQGFTLDREGAGPAGYRSGEQVSEFEQNLWARFWSLANNPDAADEAGVRAAHGEAPSIKLQSGKNYRVLLRASGGLEYEVEKEIDASQPTT